MTNKRTVTREEVQVEVEHIGFVFLDERPASLHPEDWYLRVANGYRRTDHGVEYASWVYNATTGGLAYGRYTFDCVEAHKNWMDRS